MPTPMIADFLSVGGGLVPGQMPMKPQSYGRTLWIET